MVEKKIYIYTAALSAWLPVLFLLLNGCAPVSYEELLRQKANQTFPGVSFQQPAPIQVDYANEQDTVHAAVLDVLAELNLVTYKIDNEKGTISTKLHRFTDLIGKPATPELTPTMPKTTYTFYSTVKLASIDIGTSVAIETTFSPALNRSGNQLASGTEIVRQLFFHRLNDKLTPRLLTFRDRSITYTKDAAEVLSPDYIEYVIKNDETLSQIAELYTDGAENWEQIAKVNGIKDPRNVSANQKILIPRVLLREPYRRTGIPRELSAEISANAAPPPAGQQAPECGENGTDCIMHRVGTNESLSLIAAKYTGDVNNWHKIAAINHINDQGSIAADQAIFIPKELLLEKTDVDSRQLTFLTVFPQDTKTLRQSVLQVFRELDISILRAEPELVTSTVWKHENIRFNFSISLLNKEKGTEMVIICFVAPEIKNDKTGLAETAQQWIEGSFFSALDQAIKDQSKAMGDTVQESTQP